MVVLVAPVVRFLISTCTFGTAAPVGSVAVPTRVPVVVWAKTQMHNNAIRQSNCAIRSAVMTILQFGGPKVPKFSLGR
jgi:hypothetical protein